MFDFNAIVSAVGGSLGLFLGFSCLDFSSYLVELSAPFFKSNRNSVSHRNKDPFNDTAQTIHVKNLSSDISNFNYQEKGYKLGKYNSY